MSLTAQAGMPIPASASVGLILVDGVLYADLSAFADLGAPEGWIGIPVGELLQAQVDAGVFKEAAAQMDPANLDPATAASLGLTSMLMNPQAFEKFMTVEKSDGADGASVFTTSSTWPAWSPAPSLPTWSRAWPIPAPLPSPA